MFVLVDNPKSGPLSSLNESSILTKGYRLNIFLVSLLFGLIIIVILSLSGLSTGLNSGLGDNSSSFSELPGLLIVGFVGLLYNIAIGELYRQLHEARSTTNLQDTVGPIAPVQAIGPTSGI